MNRFLTLGTDGRKTLEDVPLNFSYREIAPNEEIEIPQGQQMLLSGALLNEGQLTNLGQVVLIDLEDDDTPAPPFPDLPDDNFSHITISANVTKTIPQGQQMNCFGQITNLGQMVMLGQVVLTQVYQEDPQEPPIALPPDNYSHKTIAASVTKTVPSNQQMILSGAIDNRGVFQNFGEVVLITAGDDQSHDYLPPWVIEQNQEYTVNRNRLLFVPFMFQNFGQLINNGRVYIGA
jgi:hypothetical protein